MMDSDSLIDKVLELKEEIERLRAELAVCFKGEKRLHRPPRADNGGDK